MSKQRNFNDFEQGKLFRKDSIPYLEGYWYYGNINFDGRQAEKPFAFSELVAAPSDDNPNMLDGLTVREIFEHDEGNNRFLLKKHLMNMPDGFHFCDPCYLSAKEEGEHKAEDEGEPVFPAGEWEVSIKGHLVPDNRPFSLLNEENTEIASVIGFRAYKHSPRGTSCWVVKPGEEIYGISKNAVQSVGVDSGLVGVFPVTNDDPYSWDEFYDEYYHYQHNPTHPAVVGKYGVFSRTAHGDGGYPIHLLFNKNEEFIGFVCSYDGKISNKALGLGRTTEEVVEAQAVLNEKRVSEKKDEFNYLNELARISHSSELSFKKYFDYDEFPSKAYGTYHGELNVESDETTSSRQEMLFSLHALPDMHYSLRIGVVDHEYRKRTEQMYLTQNVVGNDGNPYVPEWDDNYPDRKIFEAVSENPVFDNEELPDLVFSLMRDLKRVPEEQALFM